jgi:hypothetical protein
MYGLHYILKFSNRRQNDIYRIEIWEKDFFGATVNLTGAETPFTIAWTGSDTDILTPIQALGMTISFNALSSALSIDDFYSDDDEKFRVDYYFESFANGTGTAKLLNTGFLIEEGISEAITDVKHVITLKATDNLALLKQVKYDEVAYFVDFPLLSTQPLQLIVSFILNKTSLFNLDQVIDQSLPLRIFDNVFENTTDDRSVVDTNDPFAETTLNTGLFFNEDNSWQDCYSILEKILKSKNACIIQADGCWNILRIPEYRLFTDGAIPGTQYHFNGSTTDVDAVTLAPLVAIERNGTDVQPINEDQTKGILRPLRYVKETFNYKQPGTFIVHSDLQLPNNATPYNTSTVGDIIYKKYSIATYFPEWVQRKSDDSYLQTEFSISQNREIDRYIYTPGHVNEQRGVQFPPIPVTRFDKPDFSLQFKSLSSSGSTLRFWIRFDLFDAVGNSYNLTDVWQGTGPHWNPSTPSAWDADLGFYYELATGEDKTQWTTWDFLSIAAAGSKDNALRFPADGMLLIEVFGTNGSNTSNRQDTVWKDIRLTIDQFINDSTLITGQTHLDNGSTLPKAIHEDDVELDDSPRNTIAGTLFTDARTNFDYTDSTTGEATGIGDIYFTKTKLWHRAAISESLRLGNIIALEILQLNYTSRNTVEGTFKNLRYDTNKFITPLCLFTFPLDAKLSGKYFIAASITLDYMACTFNGKLVEIFKDDEDDFLDTYFFNYLYQTN